MTMSSYLLCSSSSSSSSSSSYSSSSSSSFPFQFEFPTKSSRSFPSTVIFRANSFKAYLSLAPANHSSVRNVAIRNEFRFRRGLLFTVTLPFILSSFEFLGGFAAKAEESGTHEYQFIKDEVRKVVSKGKAAGVLRLVFHDAGTFDMDEPSGGMNGSIIYELERPENAGLKKSLKILEKAKLQLDASEPDLIAVAGAEAVSVCGGPEIHIALGRTDSAEPDPEGKLPQESLDASGLKKCFQRKGLSVQDLVALSGAHTLGSKGFGNPTVFDNSYFKILLEKPWKSSAGMSSMVGLPSDRALVEDEECIRWISNYANDQNLFFEDFKAAYTKLVNMGARWKNL